MTTHRARRDAAVLGALALLAACSDPAEAPAANSVTSDAVGAVGSASAAPEPTSVAPAPTVAASESTPTATEVPGNQPIAGPAARERLYELRLSHNSPVVAPAGPLTLQVAAGNGAVASSVILNTFGAATARYDLRGWEVGDPPLSQLELADGTVVATGWSGKHVAVANLDGSAAERIPDVFSSSVLPVTHLIDAGIHVAGGSPVGWIGPDNPEAELVPWPDLHAGAANGGPAVLAADVAGRTILAAFGDNTRLAVLADPDGKPLDADYTMEGTPSFANPARTEVAVLTCQLDHCTLYRYAIADLPEAGVS